MASTTDTREPSLSSAWTAHDAESLLAVYYVAATITDSPRGPTDYQEILHGKEYAHIATVPKRQDENYLSRFENYFETCASLDVKEECLASVLSLVAARNRDHQTSVDTEEEAAVRRVRDDIVDCCSKVRREQLTSNRDLYTYDFKQQSLREIFKFLTCLRDLFDRCLLGEPPDESSFKELFQFFAWIFSIRLRSVSTCGPLVVREQNISTLPHLIFDKTDGRKILAVTVGEVKKAVPTPQSSEHPTKRLKTDKTRRRSCIENDTVDFADDIRGQHAVQLVRELPNTFLPNKQCMLGFVIQETKVRLTCLKMDQTHRRQICRRDFDPSAHRAETTFTKAYDLLNRSDRRHLIYIMVALADLAEQSHQ